MRIKLACFDFDGTLMKTYSFKAIFEAFGLEERFMKDVLARWRADEITLREFDEKAVMLLKGLAEKEVVEQFSMMEPMPGAAELVDYLRSKGVRTAIITCAPPYFPKIMAEKLGMDWWTSNECEVDKDGVLTGKISRHNLPTALDKAKTMEQYAKRVGCSLQETAALGDSRIDLEMLKSAGLGIAVNLTGDAPIMRAACKYCVDDLYGALEVFRKELVE